MSKVFLSHSSADKAGYVDIVYKKLVKALGCESVIIDNMAFQEGRDVLEEIYAQLDVTDLFVIFLSNKALSSEWVQLELKKVERLLDGEKEMQICPMIIDNIVRYDDVRIPAWMQNKYNIKNIASQNKASNLIIQRMAEISYEKYPKLRERDLLFVGRNEYVQKFEERMDDFLKERPVVIMASGLEGVGRRSFLKNSLYKSNIVKNTFAFSTITLNSDESIEDCILKIYDLGGKCSDKIDIALVNSLSMEKKIDLLKELVIDLQTSNELLICVDNGCIVSHEGELADWFQQVICSVNNKITFLLVCKFRYFHRSLFLDRIYNVALPELDVSERGGLLNRYLELEEVELDVEKKKTVNGLLTGLPEQVFFAVAIIKNYGWEYFYKNIHDVVSFYNRKAASMLQQLKNDNELMEFIALMCSFDCVSISMLMSIVSNEEKYKEYISKLYKHGICEYVGVLGEYIRVNDTIKDYIQRSEYNISNEHEIRLKEKAKVIIDNISDGSYDIPDLLNSLKISLKDGKQIDDKYIIPSIYLKTMTDLYNTGKNKDVVHFAYRALNGNLKMDDRIVFEIRYLLCSALAKLRSDNFRKEVMNINGPDHDFLFGFYYRQIGKFAQALDKINKSLEDRPNFSKAKREKVQIYIGMQDYESAVDLARANYQNYKDNPYHIQAYFACVIKSDTVENKAKLLQELIKDIENIDSKMAEELTFRFKAQYAAFIDNDYDKAMEEINQAINMNETLQYARLVKFDIAEKFNDIHTMQDVVDFFSKDDLNKRYGSAVIYMKSLIKARKGEVTEAITYFTNNIKYYTDDAKDRFILRLRKYENN